MSATGALLLVWLAAALAQGAGWYWQQRRRNAGIVDVIWAGGVGGAAVLLASLGDGALAPRLTLAVLGGVWGLRLAWHLWQRVRGEDEDGRYAQLRQRWGDGPWLWFAFFQFQAALIVLFSLPFLAAARNPQDGITLALVGAATLWIIAVVGESIADRQLQQFRDNPANRGRTCRTGLWRYSRHPNYFFEWLGWVASPIIAISPLDGLGAGGWWQGWLSLIGPLLMYWLLVHVSGIPPLEAHMLKSRGDAFKAYMARTSAFFPLPPRKN